MSRSRRPKFYTWTVRFFVLGREWQGSRTWSEHLSSVEYQAPAEAEEQVRALFDTGLVFQVWAVGPGGDVAFDVRMEK